MTRLRPSKPGSVSRPALVVALFAVVYASHAWAEPGKRAWTAAAVSSGLHSLGQAATVAYNPGAKIPAGSVITKVYANRDYAGQADVQSSLCWGGIQRCVDIVGRSINTPAFNGLEAGGPIYLVHRVHAWHGSHQPLYVKGNVTVWYDDAPGQRQSR